MTKAYCGEPSYLTASPTGICYGLPSATNAGPRGMYNDTAIRKHFVEDVVLRPIVREAGSGRPSALPTRVQLFISVLGVVEGTLRGLGSARGSRRP